jgi:rare lipoprotein A
MDRAATRAPEQRRLSVPDLSPQLPRPTAGAAKAGVALIASMLLAACSAQNRTQAALPAAAAPEITAATASADGTAAAQASKPSASPATGRTIAGRKTGGSASGLASWYGARFHGRRTANGEIYDLRALTAAHPSLPLPSYARITNVSNGRSIVVRVNDRGPFHRGRAVDVSQRAAEVLGFKNAGVGNVKIDYVGRAAPEGTDERKLLATYQEFGQPRLPEGVQIAGLKPIADAELARGAGGETQIAAAPAPVAQAAPAPALVAANAGQTAQQAGAAPQPTVAVAAYAPVASTGSVAPVRSRAAPAEPARSAAAGEQKSTPAKRTVQPSEPVLASSAPQLRPSVAEDSGAPKPAAPSAGVSARIAASFEGFGSSAFDSAPQQSFGAAFASER